MNFYGTAWEYYPAWTENYSTAETSQSLSITSIPGKLLTDNNSTMKSAILYYENPTGNVSASLQRTTSRFYPDYRGDHLDASPLNYNWVDTASQESTSLPHEFRNTPKRNSSKALYSHTLYESDANATYSALFTGGAKVSNWTVGALFCSPNPSLRSGKPFTEFAGYTVGSSGTGNFSSGMHCNPHSSE